MPSTTTVCDRGFTCHTEFDGFDLVIDAAGEDGPTSNEVLLADYASCFVPALRVGGRQRGIEDPGRVDIEAHGDLNADDDLAAIRFHIRDQRPIADEPITGDNRTGEGHLPRPRRPSRRASRNRNLRNRHGLR